LRAAKHKKWIRTPKARTTGRSPAVVTREKRERDGHKVVYDIMKQGMCKPSEPRGGGEEWVGGGSLRSQRLMQRSSTCTRPNGGRVPKLRSSRSIREQRKKKGTGKKNSPGLFWHCGGTRKLKYKRPPFVGTVSQKKKPRNTIFENKPTTGDEGPTELEMEVGGGRRFVGGGEPGKINRIRGRMSRRFSAPSRQKDKNLPSVRLRGKWVARHAAFLLISE